MLVSQPPDGLRYAPSGYRWAGVDSAWEQKKLEARKMLENRAESPASSAPKKMGESHHFIRENGLWSTQKSVKSGDFSRKRRIFRNLRVTF